MRASARNDWSEWKAAILAALAMIPLGALAGLAALLRSDANLTKRAIAAATLNSALFSGAIAALIFWKFGTNQVMLASGISILAGLGGNTAIGIVLQALNITAKKFIESEK